MFCRSITARGFVLSNTSTRNKVVVRSIIALPFRSTLTCEGQNFALFQDSIPYIDVSKVTTECVINLKPSAIPVLVLPNYPYAKWCNGFAWFKTDAAITEDAVFVHLNNSTSTFPRYANMMPLIIAYQNSRASK